MPRTMGHRAGMSTLKQIVKACDEIGIEALTVFAFSTENWKRPGEEVNFLMNLLVEFLHKELLELHENNVCIRMLGDHTTLPGECRIEIERALSMTRDNQGLRFNIALNYGSRRELLDAVLAISLKLQSGEIQEEDINETLFSSLLYTHDLPDPDLLIRTAGEMRISNFLLWQIAYTELWVTDSLWPDFTTDEFCKAIWDYQKRERRFGGLNSSPGQDEDYA
jgi:undecaprenyl diphosphate synthase